MAISSEARDCMIKVSIFSSHSVLTIDVSGHSHRVAQAREICRQRDSIFVLLISTFPRPLLQTEALLISLVSVLVFVWPETNVRWHVS